VVPTSLQKMHKSEGGLMNLFKKLKRNLDDLLFPARHAAIKARYRAGTAAAEFRRRSKASLKGYYRRKAPVNHQNKEIYS
jgi:hypothetical protein